MTTPLTTPLEEAIERAKTAGACDAEIRVLRKLARTHATVGDLLDDPKAAWWACWYASEVLRRRWPEAEAVIATNPGWAYVYARDVIRSRWPEAEAVIATEPPWADRYGRHVPGVPANWKESTR